MDVEKNGGRLFRRPKLTLSCSAEGKEGRMRGVRPIRNITNERYLRTLRCP
jgi:hypothetical protein